MLVLQIEGESFSDRLRQVPMKRGTDLHQEMTHLMVKEPVDNPGDIDKHKYQVEGLDTVGKGDLLMSMLKWC